MWLQIPYAVLATLCANNPPQPFNCIQTAQMDEPITRTVAFKLVRAAFLTQQSLLQYFSAKYPPLGARELKPDSPKK